MSTLAAARRLKRGILRAKLLRRVLRTVAFRHLPAPKAGPGPARYNIDTAVGSPDALGRLHTASSSSLTGKGSLASRSTSTPGPGAYRLPSSIGYQPLAHHKSSIGVSFGRSPSRIHVTPGYKPHGPGLMLPALYQCDVTPGMIY